MRGHEEFERILASYRDAPPEEQARADAHVAACPACAARLAAFGEVDAKLAALAEPALPARLSQPLAGVIAAHERQASAPRGASRFVFTPTPVRMLVPAAVVLLVLVALSVLMMSLNSGRTLVTSTPTLTTTLTPTTIAARETEPAALARFARGAVVVSPTVLEAGPTPAPAPEPSAGKTRILLAGYTTHATMIH